MDKNLDISEQTLKNLDSERKSKAKIVYIFILIACIIEAIILALVFFDMKNKHRWGLGYEFPLITACVLLAICFVVYYSLAKKYSKTFFEKVIKPELENFFEDIDFQRDKSVSMESVRETGLIPMGNRFSGGNYIKAKYKGKDFVYSDVCTSEVTKNNKGEEVSHLLFLGQWLEFDFKKEITNRLFIIENPIFESMNLKRITFESEQFNKEFSVFCADGHTAFYVITPPIIERIMEINRKIRGKFYFALIGSKIYVGINTNRRSFAVSLFKKLDKKTINIYRLPIIAVCTIIDLMS